MERIRMYLNRWGKKHSVIGCAYLDILKFGMDASGKLREVVVLLDGDILATFGGDDLFEDLMISYEAQYRYPYDSPTPPLGGVGLSYG